MNINDVYKECDKYDFSGLDICSKNQAISMLICYIKNIPMKKFHIIKNEIILTEAEQTTLFDMLDNLILKNVPIQYLIGEVSIYNETYIVNSSVLIPRQDTELLIEKAIEYINKKELKNGLDLCCGSGAIGISVCNNSNIETMDFLDISKEALSVTQKNILKNKVTKKTKCINSDLFTNLVLSKNSYDVIISNPPYIPTSDMNNLSEYVKSEPKLALDGGRDGLDFYRKIIDRARSFLRDKGYIMFEIGYNQMDDITNLFNEYSEYEIIDKIKDLNLNDRVIICRFHKI